MKAKHKLVAVILCFALFINGTGSYAASIDLSILDNDDGASSERYDDNEPEPEPEPDPEPEPERPAQNNNQSKYQAEIDRVSADLEQLKEEKKKIQAEINSVQDARDKERVKANNYERDINITSNEIGLLLERIALLEQDIAEKEQEIEEKQGEIDHSYQTFKTRLRAMQLNDSTSTLGLLLGADSFSDFLTRTQTISRIAESDQALMEDLAQQKVELQEMHYKLEDTRVRTEQDREDMEKRKSTLGTQLSATRDTIQDIERLEREFLANLQQNQAKQQDMQRELESIYERMRYDENPYVGGTMGWPVPGAYKITSGYGMRFNNTNMHTGVDITYQNGGTHGAKVVAANDGTVSLVNWQYRQGSGYGIFLIIDHGGKVTTLYAHLSNIIVKQGDRVTRGQHIGNVGSTGWSTGPHLHFEVRENGVHKNPMNYLGTRS